MCTSMQMEKDGRPSFSILEMERKERRYWRNERRDSCVQDNFPLDVVVVVIVVEPLRVCRQDCFAERGSVGGRRRSGMEKEEIQ